MNDAHALHDLLHNLHFILFFIVSGLIVYVSLSLSFVMYASKHWKHFEKVARGEEDGTPSQL